jgi:hypothetical protein
VTINERIEAGQRDRRVLIRVSRAAWRQEQAGRNGHGRCSRPAEGISILTLAAATGLSPSWVHQFVADAGLDALDAAPGAIQSIWPQTVAYRLRTHPRISWHGSREVHRPALAPVGGVGLAPLVILRETAGRACRRLAAMSSNHRALVAGASIAGLTAAVLRWLGWDVHLVDRRPASMPPFQPACSSRPTAYARSPRWARRAR